MKTISDTLHLGIFHRPASPRNGGRLEELAALSAVAASDHSALHPHIAADFFASPFRWDSVSALRKAINLHEDLIRDMIALSSCCPRSPFPRLYALSAVLLAAINLAGASRLMAGEWHIDQMPTCRQFYEQAEIDSAGRSWKSMFNGENLEGWKVVLANAPPGEDPESIFQVVDGEIHVFRDTPAGRHMPFGVILSDDAFANYRFRFEYKWGEKKFAPRAQSARDAGLLFHVVGPETIWPMSVECQVQEGDVGDTFLVSTGGDSPIDPEGKSNQFAADGTKLGEFYRAGQNTRVIKSQTLEHPGWNTVEVIVRGPAAIYLVNGEINNYVVNMRAPQGANGELVPLTSGRLALQCEGAEVFYRNLEVLSLEPKAAVFIPADESAAPVPARSPQDGLKSWKIRDGFRVELVAAEPLIMDPVAIDWGLDGKLWVAEMADYPLGMDGNGQAGGRIRFLEQSQPHGAYDRSTLFLDGVNFPTGVVSWGKGVIVTAAPEIFYAEDTNGDGTCDLKNVLFSGFNEGNQQLRINGLRWGLDGWLHCASGGHHAGYGSQSKVHAHLTGKDILLGSRDFRFHPGTGQLEPLTGPSQFGRNNDDAGNWFGVQNSYPLWHYVLEDRYLRRNPHFVAPDARQLLSESNPRVFPVAEIGAQPNPQTRVGRFTSACSGMVYRDQFLPLNLQSSHAFTCEPVHNLVQHNLLERSGASFVMQRDAAGEAPDFLASIDPWCRPVMVRTGPDGALWVVDMYRYLIEHPQWVPDAAKAEMAPFLRLGDGRGRLYRVLPASGTDRKVPQLANADALELVPLLDHPNGWVRDSAQRRLVELHDARCLAPLKELLESNCSAPGKLHAAYALNSLSACDSAVISRMLDADSADVRRHALKLAEQLTAIEEELMLRIAKLVDDPSDVVRLQLACSLGEWNHPLAIQTFARMWQNPTLDRHVETALFSSLNQHNIAMALEAATNLNLENDATRDRYRKLLAQSVAFGQVAPIELALQHRGPAAEDWARVMIGLDVVYRRPANSSANPILDDAAVAEVHQHGRSLILEEDQAPSWLRTLGVNLLFRRAADQEADQSCATQVLSRTNSPSMQTAVVQRLGELQEIESGRLMLTGWPSYVPSTREAVFEAWASHPEWYSLLVDAIDHGDINPHEISLPLQARFLGRKQLPVVQELQKRFDARSSSSGMPAISAKEVLQLSADVEHGQQVFQKNCKDCHQFRGEGVLVGPNLSSVTGRTPESLLEAIIQPNKAIEPKYLNYTIGLTDGRVLSGLIESDSGNSITLLKAKGEKTFVLQTDIEELRSTGKSLMPEGFDRTIPLQDLADLILYLQQTEGSVSHK